MLRIFFCLMLFSVLNGNVFAQNEKPDIVVLEKKIQAICEKHIIVLEARMLLIRTRDSDQFCIFDIWGSLDSYSAFETHFDAEDFSKIVFFAAAEFLEKPFLIEESDEIFKKIITRAVLSLVGFLEKQEEEPSSPPKKNI